MRLVRSQTFYWGEVPHTLKDKPETPAAVALALVAICASRYAGNLFGHEIVVTFFIGQILAEAIFWLWLLLLVLNRDHDIGFDILTLLAFATCIAAHLVPAPRIVCVYGLVLLSKMERSAFIRLAIFSVGVFIIMAVHPNVRAMFKNSSHEGYLEFTFQMTFLRQSLLIGCLTLLSVLTWWRSKSSPAEYLAYTGLAVATLAALQIASFAFGYGSSYAIRKHFFAVLTLLPVMAIVFAFEFRFRPMARSRAATGSMFGILMTSLILWNTGIMKAADIDYFASVAAQYKSYRPNETWIALSKAMNGSPNGAIMLGEFGRPGGQDFQDAQESHGRREWNSDIAI